MSTSLPTLGKYQLHEELGHGGFATVYRAHDPDLGLDVALKVLSANFMRDPAFVDRFRTEARVTARLKHPNIARVINIDQADGRLFLAIEYVPGRNLRDRLHDQPLLDWPLITSIVQQVGDALDYAHGQGVLHRDVKPNNILVTDDGLAVLTDFGLAKAAEGSGMTTSGVALGTFKYIAPEQANGKEVDARSDLYSLAVVAYELCTGRAPFNSDSTPALIHAQVYDAPPAPSQLNARVAPPIEQVLLKGLSKEREARYRSGKELATALSAAVEQTIKEYVGALIQQSANYEQQSNYDAAEEKLRQVFVIQPNQIEAKALLVKINEQRDARQRYTQLVQKLMALRTEAAALQKSVPLLPDPDKALQILASPKSVSELTGKRQSNSSVIRVSLIKQIAIGLLVIGGLLAIIGLLVFTSWANYYYIYSPKEYSQLIAYGLSFCGLLVGMGVGGLFVGILWLIVGNSQSKI